MRRCGDCASYHQRTGLCARSGVLDYGDWRSYPAMQREDVPIMAWFRGTCGLEARFFEPRDRLSDELMEGMLDDTSSTDIT